MQLSARSRARALRHDQDHTCIRIYVAREQHRPAAASGVDETAAVPRLSGSYREYDTREVIY